jgi:hypothetical protein
MSSGKLMNDRNFEDRESTAAYMSHLSISFSDFLVRFAVSS